MKKHLSLWRHRLGVKSTILMGVIALLSASIPVWTHAAFTAGDTTAWQNGHLVMDTSGVIQRSNIVLQAPNLQPTHSMPLGNGVLGAAAWSANGQTITQLWNGSYTQSGSTVSVTNLSYNGAIAPGGTTNFCFNGSWNGTNAAPTAFVLNGQTCALF